MTLKGDAGNSWMNNAGLTAGSQPNTSDISKDVPACSQLDESVAAGTNRTSFSNMESLECTISVYQPDGLNILISSNEGSKTLDKLQTYCSPDPVIQHNGADDSTLPLPTALPAPEKINMNGKTNISVGILHEHEAQGVTKVSNESTDGKDGDSPIELSQHTTNKDKVEIHAGEHLKIDKDALVLSVKEAWLTEEKGVNIAKDLKKVTLEHTAGKDMIVVVESGPSITSASEQVEDLNATSEVGSFPLVTHVSAVGPLAGDARETYHIEIIKSIVYGGLFESITSLGVVSSAAAGGTATINLLALALANLISGLVFIYHNLKELKKDPIQQASDQLNEGIDRYKELLGQRQNFITHATVAVVSFLLFGMIPPITYAFSFRLSDNWELKLAAVGAASLVCIILLATGKAYVRNSPKSYLKTVMYYVIMGFMVSGISCAAGELIERLLEKFHLFQSNSLLIPSSTPGKTPYRSGRATY